MYGINWGWGNAKPKADLRRGHVLAKHGDSDTVIIDAHPLSDVGTTTVLYFSLSFFTQEVSFPVYCTPPCVCATVVGSQARPPTWRQIKERKASQRGVCAILYHTIL